MALRAKSPKETKIPKPKTILYGTAGVGKTWASLDFPKVYYIDTEGGASLSHYTDKLVESGGAYLGVDDGANDLSFILEELKSLHTEKHDFKTVVIDSITKPFNEAIMHAMAILEKANPGKATFGKEKQPAIALMRQIVSLIEKIDMNVIMIAHEKPKWSDSEQIGFTYDCWDKIEYDLHMSARITKVGSKRFLTPSKSRLKNFPENTAVPWSFEEFSDRYEGEFGVGILSRDVEVAVLATPETLMKFNSLVDVLKPDPAKLKRWLKAGKAERFEEMEEGKMQGCIKVLQKEIDLLNK